MIKEIKIPNLGLTMEEAKVAKIHKKEGDSVQKGEVVFSIQTDKAVFEVESPSSGILHIAAKEEEVHPIGTVIGWLAESREKYETYLQEDKGKASYETPAVTLLPEKTETLQPGLLKNVAKELRLKGIKSSPAARRVAFEKGIDLSDIKGTGPGGRIREGDVLAALEDAKVFDKTVMSTPLARKIAVEKGIELETIEGTGPSGRITKEDVLKVAGEMEAVSPKLTIADDLKVLKEVRPVKGVRKIIFDRMHQSLRDTAQITISMEVDATELISLRNNLLERRKQKFSYNTILVKVLAQALLNHPKFNASVVEDELYLWQNINIGIAMDVQDEGLVVPVVKDAAPKGLAVIQTELDTLIERARAKKLLPDDLQGGTFTLTNLGFLDVEYFTPILNPPEVGILGVGKIIEKPVVLNGQLAVGQRLMLSLTVDHRVIDGADTGRFLKDVKSYIEKPGLLLI